MTDPIRLAVDTLAPLLPTEEGHYTGIADEYAVVSEIETYYQWADNKPKTEITSVQVDIWKRGERPLALSLRAMAALERVGFSRTRRGSDTEQVNQVTWHRVSMDYNYSQEVD